MEFRVITTAPEGKLSIELPEGFTNQEIEVIVRTQSEKAAEDEALKELHQRRMAHFGKAKYSDFPINKYDAYNQ